MRSVIRKEKTFVTVALAALLANGLLGIGHVGKLARLQGEISRSRQVLTELARLEATLNAAESAHLRFLLARGTSSLAPLEAARTVVAIQLDRLAELERNDAAQARRVVELGLEARRSLAEWSEEVRLFREGAAAGPSPAAHARPEALRRVLDALEAAERGALAAREAESGRWRLESLASGLVTTLLGLALVVVALLLIRRELQGHAAAEAALETANTALRDADRKKDEFLASLAHELRTPLAAMRSAVELLGAAEAAEGGRAPERRAFARAVLGRQLAHLTRLVDDLLDLSRVASSRVVLRKAAVTLAEVVEAAIETTRPAIEARRHALTVKLPDERVLVEADPVRLAQVVANLLTNAAKFAPPGGRIEVSVAADDAEAVVRVTDDGIGLAPGDLERVFGFWEQGPDRPDGREGLGVGLALSRKLAQLHGGTLLASSPGPGRGSTFTLRLPRASAPERAPEEPPGAATEAGPRRVLVVEDDADAAEALGELLSASGHEVRVARDGPSGLEAARGFLPDAVLLDLDLPGFDGCELARRLRATPGLEGSLLVALSGWAGSGDRARAAEAGVDHHVVKPAGIARLQEILASTGRPRP
jgi:signal transduction histidine kinase/CheY-like chemotaxis protein